MNACRPIRPTRTWQHLMPPHNDQRVDSFRDKLRARSDYRRQEHDAKIRGGVAWIDTFRGRPIPRHRALVVVQGVTS